MSLRILVFTLIEVAGLTAWAILVRVGQTLLGAGTAGVGFVLEHVVSFNVKNGRPLLQLAGLPGGALLLVAGVETATWLGWRALVPWPVVAGVVLAAGLAVGHALELNTVNRLPLFRSFLRRVGQTLDITVLETFAGAVVLAQVFDHGLISQQGALAVAAMVGLFQLEHVLSVRKKVE